MFRSHKIHMRPNKVQAGLLLQAAGTARYVYNDGLAKWDKMWEAWKADHSLPKPNANLLSRMWTKERPECLRTKRLGFSYRKMNKLIGNSIVVNVLAEIFKMLFEKKYGGKKDA